MSYSPITPAVATLYFRCIPNLGDCYTDSGATTAATTDGQTLLAIKDSASGRIAAKVSTGGSSRNCLLKISGGIKRMNFTSSGVGTYSNGAVFRKNDDSTYNPGSRTLFLVLSTVRWNKLGADIICDPGNSLSGSVTQIGSNSGWLSTFNNSTWPTAPAPYISLANYPVIVAVRLSATNGVELFRHDHYGSDRQPLKFSTGRNITSSATGTGFCLGGRNALDLFLYGDIYAYEDWNGEMTDAEVRSQIAALYDYFYTQLGLGLGPSGTQTTIIIDGDSNAAGIADTQWSESLGGSLLSGLVGTYPDLAYYVLAAPSRQYTHLNTATRYPKIDMATATKGRCLIVYMCGENDESVTDGHTVYSRIQTEAQNIKAACPWVKILVIEPPHRGDSDTSGAVAALKADITADPTFGGYVDGCWRTQNDTIFSDRTTYTTPNTTYVNGDKVHHKDAWWDRACATANATNVSPDLLTLATTLLAAAPLNHGQNDRRRLRTGGMLSGSLLTGGGLN
jgi:hypothetical protein